MTSTDDEVPEVIEELRRNWDLTRYAGAGEERATARAEVIAEAVRRLPECVPVRRATPRTAWCWTNRWGPRADPEDVALAVLNDRPGAMDQLKGAVTRTPRGPEVLNSLRTRWDELHRPVMRHQVTSVQGKRKKLITETIERLPEVVRHIGFFRSRPGEAPICEWSSGARKERIAEAVLNDEPGAMDRLCASMDPAIVRSGHVILEEMQRQWASLRQPVRDLGLLRYAETFDPETGTVEDITLESVNAARHERRDEFLAYAIERLPAIAADIARPLEWRSDESRDDVVRAVLNDDEGAIRRLLNAMAPSGNGS